MQTYKCTVLSLPTECHAEGTECLQRRYFGYNGRKASTKGKRREIGFLSQLAVSGDLNVIVISFFSPIAYFKNTSIGRKFWSAMLNNAFCTFTAFFISINVCNILSWSVFILL